MNESISKIVDRVSDALNFFDFSFIVSGGMTFSILYLTAYKTCSIQLLPTFSTPVKVILCIGMVYICGLLSFAAGKSLRLKILYLCNKKRRFSKIFTEALEFAKAHTNERCEELERYNENPDDEKRLKRYYTLMWMELRHCKDAEATIRHLNRFWVMQAVFEGLFFSFILATVCSCILADYTFTGYTATALVCAYFCYIEARRYAETQINEIVITYTKFILHGNKK